MYFLFVVLLCAVSLVASIIVMYVHNRSSGDDASLAMPTWVSSLMFQVILQNVTNDEFFPQLIPL